MRVSIDKKTGMLIEAQSGDNGPIQTLKDNANGWGYKDADVECKVVSDAEFATLLDVGKDKAKIDNEALVQQREREMVRRMAIAELISEGKLAEDYK